MSIDLTIGLLINKLHHKLINWDRFSGRSRSCGQVGINIYLFKVYVYASASAVQDSFF